MTRTQSHSDNGTSTTGVTGPSCDANQIGSIPSVQSANGQAKWSGAAPSTGGHGTVRSAVPSSVIGQGSGNKATHTSHFCGGVSL